jgi:4-hydroxybenzoate polyprenyltransferase
MNRPLDLLKLMRPSQWLKNIFVFTGIIFGDSLANFPLLWKVFLAASAFALASSCIYIINDIADIKNDRMHPKKRHRPLPAGKVSIPFAVGLSVFAGIGGLALAFYVSPKILAIILAYMVLNLAYSFKLKEIVILDVFCISAGFMLRIFAGTFGVNIPPSRWLLLCGLLMTLFLGFAKRRAEMIALKNNKSAQREVLQNYDQTVLDTLSAICATGVIMGYSLYTMSPETIALHRTQNLIFTVPFVIYALFRYIYIVHHCASGGDPTYDLVKDKHIITSVIGWIALTTFLIAF